MMDDHRKPPRKVKKKADSDVNSTQYQQRERERKKTLFSLFLIILVVLIIADVAGGSSVQGCLIPITCIFGLFAIAAWVELRIESPQRVVASHLIDQELEWLVGPEKVKAITPLEFIFAQERIRQRRAGRWRFMLLSLPLWIPVIYTLFMVPTFQTYDEPTAAIIALIMGGCVLLLIVALFIRAFPTKWVLARQEAAALSALANEVYAQYLPQMKPHTWYKLSYDGELVEMSEQEMLANSTIKARVGLNDIVSNHTEVENAAIPINDSQP